MFPTVDPAKFYGTARRIAADTSAATLGYIIGGVKGAKRAVQVSKSLPIEMKRKYEGGSSSSVKRARIIGKTRFKAIRGRRRGVFGRRSVSKKITKSLNPRQKRLVRRIATSVVHDEEPQGKYLKRYVMYMPTSVGTTTSAVQNVINTGLYGAANQEGTTIFSVGSGQKIIDAASVLYNGKTKGFNVSSTTNNLSYDNLIIPDFYHRIDYTFHNNTPVIMEMYFIESSPKTNMLNNFYQNWNAALEAQVGTDEVMTYLGNRPQYSGQMKRMYNMKTTKRLLKPGERFTYTLKTYAKHVKFNDFIASGSASTQNWYQKGLTKELCVIFHQPATTYLNGASTSTLYSYNVENAAGYAVSVDAKEYISMRKPENVADSVGNIDGALVLWNYQYSEPTVVPTANVVVHPKAISIVQAQQ